MKNVIISFFIFLLAANNAFATENNAVFDAKGRKVFNSTVPLDLNKQNAFDWNVYFVIKKDRRIMKPEIFLLFRNRFCRIEQDGLK